MDVHFTFSNIYWLLSRLYVNICEVTPELQRDRDAILHTTIFFANRGLVETVSRQG